MINLNSEDSDSSKEESENELANLNKLNPDIEE
jgi:hypothetical protein